MWIRTKRMINLQHTTHSLPCSNTTFKANLSLPTFSKFKVYHQIESISLLTRSSLHSSKFTPHLKWTSWDHLPPPPYQLYPPYPSSTISMIWINRCRKTKSRKHQNPTRLTPLILKLSTRYLRLLITIPKKMNKISSSSNIHKPKVVTARNSFIKLSLFKSLLIIAWTQSTQKKKSKKKSQSKIIKSRNHSKKYLPSMILRQEHTRSWRRCLASRLACQKCKLSLCLTQWYPKPRVGILMSVINLDYPQWTVRKLANLLKSALN